jgi:hypothetical protein
MQRSSCLWPQHRALCSQARRRPLVAHCCPLTFTATSIPRHFPRYTLPKEPAGHTHTHRNTQQPGLAARTRAKSRITAHICSQARQQHGRRHSIHQAACWHRPLRPARLMPRTCAYANPKRDLVASRHLLTCAGPCALHDQLVAAEGLVWGRPHNRTADSSQGAAERAAVEAGTRLLSTVLLLVLRLLLLHIGQALQAVAAGLPCSKLPVVLSAGRTELRCLCWSRRATGPAVDTVTDMCRLSVGA